VPPLVDLLVSSSATVRDQAIWCLGNVAGDGAELRDALLQTPNALENLIRNVEYPESETLLRNALWALANCCRGKPAPETALVAPLIPVLVRALCEAEDEQMLSDSAWGLSYLTDGDDDRVDMILAHEGVAERLVALLEHDSAHVALPALRVIGNIVTGADRQTERCMRAGILPRLVRLIQGSRRHMRREACWAASNIAAGSKDQIAALIATPGMVPALLQQMATGEWAVRKEAAWAVSNLATQARPDDVRHVVAAGAIGPICSLLSVDDTRILHIMLETTEAIFKLAQDNDTHGVYPGLQDYVRSFDEHEGLRLIETLQDHADARIYERAQRLITEFINEADEQNGDDAAEDTHTHVDCPAENSAPRFGGFGQFRAAAGAPLPFAAPAPPAPSTGRFGFGGSIASSSGGFGKPSSGADHHHQSQATSISFGRGRFSG
jgi:hypothetical protein